MSRKSIREALERALSFREQHASTEEPTQVRRDVRLPLVGETSHDSPPLLADLPPPLVPAEVDLRGLPGFMLRTDRLLASELFALGTAEEFRAAVVLYCRAWQQRPAASLPNDERILAAFSGTGKRWPKVRVMAMRGFVLCSDNRWYHRVLAEEAREAWDRRMKFRERSEKANLAKQAKRPQATSGEVQEGGRQGSLQGLLEGGEGTGTGKGQRQGRAERSRGSRLPVDWQPGNEELAYCRQRRPDLDPMLVAEKFRNHWLSKSGKDAVKVDWGRTWQNWVLSEGGNRGSGRRAPDAPQHRKDFYDGLDERAAA